MIEDQPLFELPVADTSAQIAAAANRHPYKPDDTVSEAAATQGHGSTEPDDWQPAPVEHLSAADKADPYADHKANNSLSEQPGRGAQSQGNNPWNQPPAPAEAQARRGSLSPAEQADREAAAAARRLIIAQKLGQKV